MPNIPMRHLALAAALAAVSPSPSLAADSWGLDNEKAVLLSGTVVDLLCAVAGDCPADCGAGKRQLGLLDEAGRLYPAVKGNVFFAGAVADLLPYCGQTIEIDGLLIENPEMPVLFVQAVKGPGDAELKPATAFADQWAARNGEADEWYRADPLVKSIIAEDGVYGIEGLEPEQ